MKEEIKEGSPKYIEMTYNVFEKMLMSVDFRTKEEIEKLAEVMNQKVQNAKYPDVLRKIYAEAKRKIELLTLEQLQEIKNIVQMD